MTRRTIARTLVLLAVLAEPAAANSPRLIGNTGGSATASKYYAIDTSMTYINAEANAQTPMGSNGTLKSMTFWVSAAPGGAGKSWTLMVRKGGANTTHTATIENTATSASFTGDVDIAANDLLCVYLTSANTPAAATVYWEVVYDTDTPHQQWITLRDSSLNTAAGTNYIPLTGINTGGASGSYVCWPVAGTMSNMHATLSAAPGAGVTRVLDFSVNGSAANALDKTAGAADTSLVDDTNTVSITAGDLLRLDSVVSGGTAAASSANISFVFTPTDTDEWALCAASYSTTLNTGSTVYAPVVGWIPSGHPTTTEGQYQMMVNAMKITKVYWAISGTAGDGKSYTATFRDDGDTALAAAISGASATAANATSTVNVASGSLISTSVTPSGTPTARYISGIGYTVDDSTTSAVPVFNHHIKGNMQ